MEEVLLWKERYTEAEEASAHTQSDLNSARGEIKRLEATEDHLKKEREESRRLQFEIRELQASIKKQSSANAMPQSVAVEIREQGSDGPMSRTGLWAYFGILMEPGPYGVPYGLTLYFFMIHFVAWYFRRGCF